MYCHWIFELSQEFTNELRRDAHLCESILRLKCLYEIKKIFMEFRVGSWLHFDASDALRLWWIITFPNQLSVLKCYAWHVSLSVREDFYSMSNSEATNKTKLLNHDTTGSNYVDSFNIEAEIEEKQHFANFWTFWQQTMN